MNEEVTTAVPMPIKRSLFLKNLILIFVIVTASILSIWIGLLQFQMPEVLPQSSGKEQFSAERAMQFLEQIANKPRPIGSVEHDRVRDYLLSELTGLGLSPEIQIVEGNLTVWGLPYEGKVENIVARIPGDESTGTIMITSHYDSDANSPGAADAGSGVAAILETIRALRESTPLKNDMIILISDGEEIGLLGAQAFVKKHPWAEEVDLVLNFEARGSSGPSVLFEMNEQNERLVAEFAKGASNPITHSFISDLYKAMPNDTDLSIYKPTGMYGLNFGFFDSIYSYHTQEDTVEQLNLKSLQHHGENMLDLVRHFGNMELIAQEDGESLYFNLIGKKVVSYSEKLVLPLMFLAVIFYTLTFLQGYLRKSLTLTGSSLGLFIFLFIFGIAYFFGKGIVTVISLITGVDVWTLSAHPSISNPVFTSMIFLMFGLILILYNFASKRIDVKDITMGGFCVWLILVCLSSTFLKGSSYAFLWPFLFGLLCFNIILFLRGEYSFSKKIISLILAMMPLVFVAPIIYLVYTLLTLRYSGILMVIISLLIVFFIPMIHQIQKRYLIMFPSILIMLGFLVLIGAYLRA
ncbi:M28 family peptidase [Robertmurraya andreesenii]|uniref:Vacuolar membrane protease n=1 Tax=Anoxybacillus andreesenii TaxID=1325932 RepID=A0ABT9V359_9BACL|nr:M28 family peptidase [Robertmurraya andreesenii]MDQ0155379.1 hypothetical protein [Robertmurraya andreesenii]